MAEDSGLFHGMDSRSLVHLPAWARWLALAAFGIVFLIAAIACCVFLVRRNSDLVIFCMSIVQTSASALAITLLLLFSQRDSNVGTFIRVTDDFLTRHVVRSLELVTVPEFGLSSISVASTEKKDIFGRLFILSAGDREFRAWIGLNVRRIFVIYFIRADGTDGFVTHVKNVLRYTFGGAEKVGFTVNYEPATIDGEDVVSVWVTADTSPDLLVNPREKLFWAQDVAMMTESFLRTALRNGLDVSTRASPGPL